MWDYRGVTFYNVDGTHCIYVEQYCVYYGFKGIQQMRAFLSVSKHITTTLLSNPPLIYTRIRLHFSIVSIFQQISEPNEQKMEKKVRTLIHFISLLHFSKSSCHISFNRLLIATVFLTSSLLSHTVLLLSNGKRTGNCLLHQYAVSYFPNIQKERTPLTETHIVLVSRQIFMHFHHYKRINSIDITQNVFLVRNKQTLARLVVPFPQLWQQNVCVNNTFSTVRVHRSFDPGIFNDYEGDVMWWWVCIGCC